jgi:hypothetical protein
VFAAIEQLELVEPLCCLRNESTQRKAGLGPL